MINYYSNNLFFITMHSFFHNDSLIRLNLYQYQINNIKKLIIIVQNYLGIYSSIKYYQIETGVHYVLGNESKDFRIKYLKFNTAWSTK